MTIVKAGFLAAAMIAVMTTAAPAAVRIQYDQIREFLSATDPLPSYEDFDRQYAAVTQTLHTSIRPVAASELKAQMLGVLVKEELRERFERMANGFGLGLLTTVSQANPILHAVTARTASKLSEDMERREFEAAQARMMRESAEINTRVVQQSLRQLPALQRISIWDDAVRIDNPADGSAIVYRPGQYIAIDTVHRQYRVVTGEAPVQTCPGMLNLKIDSTAAKVVSGLPVDEYDLTASISIGGPAGGASSSTVVDVWNTTIPASLLSMAQAAACAPLPVDRLVLYAAQQTHMDNPNLRALEMRSVLMRGHFHTLNDNDAALFAPPAGYERISPG